jgi:hypothetical protein
MPAIERLYVSAPYCMPAASGMQHDAPTLSPTSHMQVGNVLQSQPR